MQNTALQLDTPYNLFNRGNKLWVVYDFSLDGYIAEITTDTGNIIYVSKPHTTILNAVIEAVTKGTNRQTKLFIKAFCKQHKCTIKECMQDFVDYCGYKASKDERV